MSLPSNLVFTSLTVIDELQVLQVRHPLFSADIALQGAQLLTFTPTGQRPWIWLSPEAQYKQGQSLRGGIPVCWPWFGVANKNPANVAEQITPSADAASSHGFARAMEWQIQQILETCHGVEIQLCLAHSAETMAVWPFEFNLTACFKLGRELNVELTSENLSTRAFAISQALHTYFPCKQISDVTISGCEKSEYTDALDDWKTFRQRSPQRFNQEVDQIYHSAGPFLLQTGEQQLTLSADNSRSTVIWNPWTEKSKRLSQFGDERFNEMFCVETANALNDTVEVSPGEKSTLSLTLSK